MAVEAKRARSMREHRVELGAGYGGGGSRSTADGDEWAKVTGVVVW
jgi:hypothetical protein